VRVASAPLCSSCVVKRLHKNIEALGAIRTNLSPIEFWNGVIEVKVGPIPLGRLYIFFALAGSSFDFSPAIGRPPPAPGAKPDQRKAATGEGDG